ncbi:hypothetical protein F8M41_023827 [Gigaspora margarita]|uniref:C2H2-type domain-containing protein n=1 Tax=Gigaspora margarita TaxID=4874 RepID=A0A8H4EGF4_GIGMA|nr:hypothetical protein F8M41_023827 [Gigaspora margarita]
MQSLFQKNFKNKRGLLIHQTRIYSKNKTIATINTYVVCSLCPQKTFKNKQGLIRHEQIVHSLYNSPRAGIPILPQDAIAEFKKILVYHIQKKLSNNSSSAGPQCVMLSCTKSQFVGVFGGYITRYSITRCSYECFFSGQSAYNLLYQILDDENWGVRYYLQG